MPTQTFCTDVDLIQWEPNVLREAAFASQTLLAGNAELAGTTLTISEGSLEDAGIAANHVIVLGGDVNGCFPIISVDSATSLTLSVLYDDMDTIVPPVARAPSAVEGSVPFAIRTFWPQRAIVSEILQQAAGAGTILDPQTLRRPCVLGTLQLIYSALAAAAPDEAHFGVRAEIYERFYRRAMRSAVVQMDLNGDGQADVRRLLSIVQFNRV
jgi:hypothetical protein